jgi:hypothetical protein
MRQRRFEMYRECQSQQDKSNVYYNRSPQEPMGPYFLKHVRLVDSKDCVLVLPARSNKLERFEDHDYCFFFAVLRKKVPYQTRSSDVVHRPHFLHMEKKQRKRKAASLVLVDLEPVPKTRRLASRNSSFEIEVFEDSLKQCDFFSPMLEDDNKTSEPFPMDADAETLLHFRTLLYCQNIKKAISVPEFISLFSFCDFVLWEEGKQILLGQFEEVLKQVDVLHVVNDFYQSKDKIPEVWKLYIPMLLEALKERKEWKGDEDVLSCFDTLKPGELSRESFTNRAKCCKHYLPNQVLLPGLVTTFSRYESTGSGPHRISCCYNLSVRRDMPVLATEIPDAFETKYCCLHHRSDRPNDVVFRNEIRQYNLGRLQWKRPKLPTDVRSELFETMLDK